MKTRVLTAACVLAMLGGCNVHEQYHYVSSVHVPQTVTLENHSTGEKLWSYEVPVGRQLNVRFMRPRRSAEIDVYDEMRWSESALGDDNGGRPSVMRVPPASQRRLRVDIRPGPEAPANRTASTPAPAPAITAAPVPSAAAPQPASPKSRAPEGIALPDPKQSAPR
jgi:hypothetical protein